jgi:hypothetical protein
MDMFTRTRTKPLVVVDVNNVLAAPHPRRLPSPGSPLEFPPQTLTCSATYLPHSTFKAAITTCAPLNSFLQPLLEEQSGPQPTLGELQQNVYKAQRAYMRAWSRSTSGKWHRRIIFGVTGLLFFFMIFCISIIAVDVWNEDDTPYSSGRVPLEAFIMSKCPDARDCLHDMILPAMQNVSHKVDFKLSYIGR